MSSQSLPSHLSYASIQFSVSDSDCKKKVGKEGRVGLCKVPRAQLSSAAAAMGSVREERGKHANANETVSGEITDTRKGSSDDSFC